MHIAIAVREERDFQITLSNDLLLCSRGGKERKKRERKGEGKK